MTDSNLLPIDRTAMIALLARVVRNEEIKKEIAEKRKLLDEQLRDAERARGAAASAFSAFGIDVNAKEIWTQVRALIGDDAWYEGLERGGRRVVRPPRPSVGPPENADDVDLEVDDESDEDTKPTADGSPTVREIAIERLLAAGDAGTKAADIREYILNTYGRAVHEKTVGMTLYRLFKQKQARREGHIWFFAQLPAEAKNPGDGAPGLEEGKNGKEAT